MSELHGELGEAVRHFWRTRDKQGESQGASTGGKDRGSRSKVTGGAHIDALVELIARKLRDVGCADAHLIRKQRTELPGFFRPTKEWDLLVIIDRHLVASVEFKSQVGSFGNNYNNRTEEAIGNATDLWTAYREGAFHPSVRPWIGYFMLLEDAPESNRPVAVSEPHFKIFPEFRGASYSKRYEVLLTKLIRERLYDAACLILSSKDGGLRGEFREPAAELAFAPFLASLTGKVAGFMKMRGELPKSETNYGSDSDTTLGEWGAPPEA